MSSADNTTKLGNADFVFFRVRGRRRADGDALRPDHDDVRPFPAHEHGGWVSLHDQLSPLDRPSTRAVQRSRIEGAAAHDRVSEYPGLQAGRAGQLDARVPRDEGEGRYVLPRRGVRRRPTSSRAWRCRSCARSTGSAAGSQTSCSTLSGRARGEGFGRARRARERPRPPRGQAPLFRGTHRPDRGERPQRRWSLLPRRVRAPGGHVRRGRGR